EHLQRHVGKISTGTCSSMPRSRNTSTVRWLVMWARGELAVLAYFVTVMASTPDRASKPAGRQPRRASTNHENVGFGGAHRKKASDQATATAAGFKRRASISRAILIWSPTSRPPVSSAT